VLSVVGTIDAVEIRRDCSGDDDPELEAVDSAANVTPVIREAEMVPAPPRKLPATCHFWAKAPTLSQQI
jgi:hypothetical protein